MTETGNDALRTIPASSISANGEGPSAFSLASYLEKHQKPGSQDAPQLSAEAAGLNFLQDALTNDKQLITQILDGGALPELVEGVGIYPTDLGLGCLVRVAGGGGPRAARMVRKLFYRIVQLVAKRCKMTDKDPNNTLTDCMVKFSMLAMACLHDAEGHEDVMRLQSEEGIQVILAYLLFMGRKEDVVNISLEDGRLTVGRVITTTIHLLTDEDRFLRPTQQVEKIMACRYTPGVQKLVSVGDFGFGCLMKRFLAIRSTLDFTLFSGIWSKYLEADGTYLRRELMGTNSGLEVLSRAAEILLNSPVPDLWYHLRPLTEAFVRFSISERDGKPLRYFDDAAALPFVHQNGVLALLKLVIAFNTTLLKKGNEASVEDLVAHGLVTYDTMTYVWMISQSLASQFVNVDSLSGRTSTTELQTFFSYEVLIEKLFFLVKKVPKQGELRKYPGSTLMTRSLFLLKCVKHLIQESRSRCDSIRTMMERSAFKDAQSASFVTVSKLREMEIALSKLGRKVAVCEWCYANDGQSDTSYMRCVRCSRVRYCSVECQRAHWKYGGHKTECSALKGPAGKADDEECFTVATENYDIHIEAYDSPIMVRALRKCSEALAKGLNLISVVHSEGFSEVHHPSMAHHKRVNSTNLVMTKLCTFGEYIALEVNNMVHLSTEWMSMSSRYSILKAVLLSVRECKLGGELMLRSLWVTVDRYASDLEMGLNLCFVADSTSNANNRINLSSHMWIRSVEEEKDTCGGQCHHNHIDNGDRNGHSLKEKHAQNNVPGCDHNHGSHEAHSQEPHSQKPHDPKAAE